MAVELNRRILSGLLDKSSVILNMNQKSSRTKAQT